MASVTALEAKNRFGQLLERVARGEEVVITRHDRPVARLVPEGRPNAQSVREAAEALIALRTAIKERTRSKSKLSQKEIRSAIAEGRR